MDKTRFTANPHLDSEGFLASDCPHRQTYCLRHGLTAADCSLCANPVGWQEVDGVQLPPITWGVRA